MNRGQAPHAQLRPHAPQNPLKLAPKDDRLGAKVRTQATSEPWYSL